MDIHSANNGFLQGDLQALFDALYSVGAIDPVLKMDWSKVSQGGKQMHKAVNSVNSCKGDLQLLINELHALDADSLNFIAVEVAREFAEFHDRKELH